MVYNWVSEKEEVELFELICEQEKANGEDTTDISSYRALMKSVQIP